MKIIRLEAENVKKLRAVEITPAGDIVTIAGRNGQGKTSVLDAIWWALAGTAGIQAQPVRKGEAKARIRLDMGELKVERRFTAAGGTSLIVEGADGARFSSPQKMLDDLLGALSFDPLAFARMEPRKQFDELRRIAKLDIDIDKLDAQNKGDYARRTDVNRDAKAKRAAAEAILVNPGLPDEPIDEAALLDLITQAADFNARIERARQARARQEQEAQGVEASAQKMRADAEGLRARAAALDAEAGVTDERAKQLREAIDEAPPLPTPRDVTAVRAQLDEAKGVNAAISMRTRRAQIEAEAVVLEGQVTQLTESMAARDVVKREAIAATKMPVPGIGFGDGIVTYQGVPFEQASSAEQLRVSLAIAMAANPKVRVIRIQDGSLLDADSLAHITAMAREGDYQVWIERVDADAKVGILIEDGAVVAVDGQAPAAKAAS